MMVCDDGLAAIVKSGAGVLTVTLSKVEVFSAVLLCAHTARPSSALLAMVTLICPTCVQVTPSAEENPVNVLPERTSRTQYGATGPAICASCTALVPVPLRYCMFTPWPGVTKTCTKLELAAVVSRIITPDFAHRFVFCWLATRAVMVISLVNDCEA